MWYEEERPGLGEEFLQSIRESLARIGENPRLFAIVHRRIRATMARRFPYVIYFRVERARILVIAIQHGHRDPAAWRRRI